MLVDDYVLWHSIKSSETEINKALLMQFHIYTYFLRWLDLYDESNDSLEYFIAIKVKLEKTLFINKSEKYITTIYTFRTLVCMQH